MTTMTFEVGEQPPAASSVKLKKPVKITIITDHISNPRHIAARYYGQLFPNADMDSVRVLWVGE